MRMLLDTHTFLWWIMDDPRLSDAARKHLEDGRNETFFSAASAWEIAIKTRIGKLTLPSRPEQFVSEQLFSNNFLVLPISVIHALSVYELPDFHRDPFDRMLVAQSKFERLAIITSDDLIKQYGVETIW